MGAGSEPGQHRVRYKHPHTTHREKWQWVWVWLITRDLGRLLCGGVVPTAKNRHFLYWGATQKQSMLFFLSRYPTPNLSGPICKAVFGNVKVLKQCND